MAAGLGFKDFVTGEVLTAADVDGYLMQGIWVFASAAARSAAVTSPQEGNYSYLKDTNSTEYYTGSAWVAAGGGGGGGVLQVVSTTKTDTFTTSSTTFTDITGLSVTITPTSATSKIMVLVSLQASGQNGSNSSSSRLMRGATAIFIGDAASARDRASADIEGGLASNRVTSSQAPMFLDSPATTSSTTYTVQIKSTTAGNSYVNRGSADVDDSGHQRTASSITVMEIGA
jgi:hypothetical protein